MKLTSLVGVSSSDSFAAGAVIRSYTLPFVAHCFSYTDDEVDAEEDRGLKRGRYGVNNFLLFMYVTMAGIATYFAKLKIMGQILLALTWKESGDSQHFMACLCLYFIFLATMLHVFRPRQRLLRRLVNMLHQIILRFFNVYFILFQHLHHPVSYIRSTDI
jgi:hypothetical protein